MNDPKLPTIEPAQRDELVDAVRNRQPWTASGWHVNYGQSEDRMRGYNRAWDDCAASHPYRPTDGAPDEDPWRTAYVNGYEEGWYDVNHQNDDDA